MTSRAGRWPPANSIDAPSMSLEAFDHAIADFAIAYAAQNEQDYRRLLEAVSVGRVLATIEQ
jgi:hypothetical protein